MKTKFNAFGLLLALSLSVQGSIIYPFTGPFDNNGGAGNGVIPDNSIIGLTVSQTISDLEISIASVVLRFTLQNGLGDDLTGYLRLGNEISSPSYNLTTYFATQDTIPGTPTEYTLDVSSAFVGFDPNNEWTLFFRDSSPGGQTTFSAGSLDIEAVPEPTTWAIIIFGALFCGTHLVRRWRAVRP